MQQHTAAVARRSAPSSSPAPGSHKARAAPSTAAPRPGPATPDAEGFTPVASSKAARPKPEDQKDSRRHPIAAGALASLPKNRFADLPHSVASSPSRSRPSDAGAVKGALPTQ